MFQDVHQNANAYRCELPAQPACMLPAIATIAAPVDCLPSPKHVIYETARRFLPTLSVSLLQWLPRFYHQEPHSMKCTCPASRMLWMMC